MPNEFGNQPVGAKALQGINPLEVCEKKQNYDAFIENHRQPPEFLSAGRNQNTMAMLSVKFGERP